MKQNKYYNMHSEKYYQNLKNLKKIWKLHFERTVSLRENNVRIFSVKWSLERKINSSNNNNNNNKNGQNSKIVKSFKGQRK